MKCRTRRIFDIVFVVAVEEGRSRIVGCQQKQKLFVYKVKMHKYGFYFYCFIIL